jgi:hypothetical protein
MSPEPEHRATPEQVEHGFDEGVGKRPRRSAQRRVGRFGDRPETRTDDALVHRRFSEGAERRPAEPEAGTERDFSQGYESEDDG